VSHSTYDAQMPSKNPTSLSDTERRSDGRDETQGIRVSEGARRTIRFGVAFRLLGALLAITAFAVAASLTALYAFNQYRDGFNRITSSSLPALIAASELAQRSQALAANAPNLAVADSHFARQAVGEMLRDQFQEIAAVGNRLSALAPATEGLNDLIQTEASLKGNLEKLDRLVAERIEADSSATNLIIRLRNLAARVRKSSETQLSKVPEGSGARVEIEALSEWVGAAEEAIAVMLSTSSADATTRLNRLRSDFDELDSHADAALGRLSQLSVAALEPLVQTLTQYGRGAPNIFDARTAQLAAGSAVRGVLLENKRLSAEFVASAEHIFRDVQSDTRTQSNYFSGLISNYSRLFTIVTLLCIAGACGVFFYINRSIILRLQNLSESMRALVAKRPMTISVSGNDEIADMARAAQFFVSSIAGREAALRAILEASPIGAAITREDGRLLFSNSQFADQHKFRRDDLQNVDLYSLFVDPSDRPRLFGQLQRDGAVDNVEIERRRTDGSQWWSLMSMRDITFEGNQATLTWTYDITALKNIEDVLTAARDAAEEANRIEPNRASWPTCHTSYARRSMRSSALPRCCRRTLATSSGTTKSSLSTAWCVPRAICSR
jgi:PAS domain S-box-containing protein